VVSGSDDGKSNQSTVTSASKQDGMSKVLSMISKLMMLIEQGRNEVDIV
jgi:hypothetical protein